MYFVMCLGIQEPQSDGTTCNRCNIQMQGVIINQKVRFSYSRPRVMILMGGEGNNGTFQLLLNFNSHQVSIKSSLVFAKKMANQIKYQVFMLSRFIRYFLFQINKIGSIIYSTSVFFFVIYWSKRKMSRMKQNRNVSLGILN